MTELLAPGIPAATRSPSERNSGRSYVPVTTSVGTATVASREAAGGSLQAAGPGGGDFA
jgi:hypothetical protein